MGMIKERKTQQTERALLTDTLPLKVAPTANNPELKVVPCATESDPPIVTAPVALSVLLDAIVTSSWNVDVPATLRVPPSTANVVGPNVNVCPAATLKLAPKDALLATEKAPLIVVAPATDNGPPRVVVPGPTNVRLLELMMVTGPLNVLAPLIEMPPESVVA